MMGRQLNDKEAVAGIDSGIGAKSARRQALGPSFGSESCACLQASVESNRTMPGFVFVSPGTGLLNDA